MQASKISVIIVNYNTSQFTIDCIQSLCDESLMRIVVVDNNSPNDNPDLITKTFPDVQLIRLSTNVGFGEGCNTGIKWLIENTETEYFLFLNPDTIITPGLTKRLHSRFEDMSVGITAPLITSSNDKLWYGGGYFSWLKGSVIVPGYVKEINTLELKESDTSFASGCAFMTTRIVLDRCGGFDSKYFMYEEDVDFSLRILESGYKIRFVPVAIVNHLAQGSQFKDGTTLRMFDSKNPNLTYYVYYAARNRFLTVFKHGNFFQKIIFLVGFTGWFSLKGINWILHLRFDAFAALIRGVRDFFKSRQSTVDSRQEN